MPLLYSMQWIPFYPSPLYNSRLGEAADRLAKEGESLEQDDKATTYQEVKTTIQTLANKKMA